ncbi:uncharacterized protein LACBIDRAFT_297499 [Laccaria bicolor S238N-H82]|uniref:Predicted protein n=1 Tax=Laccaria bicolor (strain S238N-H82 / ATCC MYA-4686) TaxID=486041 RepID=B0DBC0_LACBS|nr:uncharacterized protein LACBIDRAFT_297499 [Laccaria bicolor S238N-H82]EDR08165.1 predicted protein [Laccaria bicolor S238N-H82]|eukprot:XP_001881235.1 predicted protein [Laccaria bicolor S238N-H82]
MTGQQLVLFGNSSDRHSHQSSEIFTTKFTTLCGTFHLLPRAEKIQVYFLYLY